MTPQQPQLFTVLYSVCLQGQYLYIVYLQGQLGLTLRKNKCVYVLLCILGGLSLKHFGLVG